MNRSDDAMVKKAALLLEQGRHNALYNFLSGNVFDEEHHAELQEMWWTAHYTDRELEKEKALTPVDRYRIRQRFPLPRSIWDGVEKTPLFEDAVTAVLREHFEIDRYPNRSTKKKLAKALGLTAHQVTTWFKNRRQRSGKNNNNKRDIQSEDEEEDSAEEPPSDPIVDEGISIKQEPDLAAPAVEQKGYEPICSWSSSRNFSSSLKVTTTTASKGFATKTTDSSWASKCLCSTSTDTAAYKDMDLEMTRLQQFHAFAQYVRFANLLLLSGTPEQESTTKKNGFTIDSLLQ